MGLKTFSIIKAAIILVVGAFFGCHPYLPAANRAHPPIAQLLKATSPLHSASAHRGRAEGGIDNSIASIAEAVAKRIPFLEVDLRASSDGEIFLYHDNRISAAKVADDKIVGRLFSSLSSGQIAQLKIKPGGYSVPTFNQVIDIIKGSNSALQLDVKGATQAMLDKLVALIESKGARENIIVQCQSLEVLKYLRERYPFIAVMPRANSAQSFKDLLLFKPEVIQGDSEWLNLELAALAHKQNTKILVRVAETKDDNSESWHTLYSAGVDIILTDYPDALIDSMGR